MSKKRLAEKEKAGDNLYRLATAILKYNGFPSTPSPKPNQTPSAKPVKAKKEKKRDIDWSFLWIFIILGIIFAYTILS